MRSLASSSVITVMALMLAGCGGGRSTTGSASAVRPVVFTAAERAGQNCGPASEHPSELVLACGMGFALSHLEWHHWGEPVSWADGSATVSDCEPNCEGGTIKTVPIQVVVSVIETCANGQRRYTKLAWSFPGGWPPPPDPSENDFNPEVRTPCPAA
jgi:hypothetical protein